MSEEKLDPQDPSEVDPPVPPAGAVPVPPAINPVPPADFAPVPPAVQPVPPANFPVPPAQQPVPPAISTPVPPAYEPAPPEYQQQPEFETIQQPPQHPGGPTLPPINQPGFPPVDPAPEAVAPIRGKKKVGGRRPAGKKKIARKQPVSRASSRRPAYMKPVDSGISFMSVLMALLGIGMLSGAVFALLPEDLSHIKGYPNDNMSNKEPRNLLAAGQKILETRTEDATFTEKEVNDYINYRLQGVQSGTLGGMMKVKGIYVDLRPKEAEIFVERSFPLIGSTTMSSVVQSQFNKQKHQQVWKMGGGSIGRIPLKDRSLQPVLNVFLRMSKVGSAELEVMNYMADVKLEEDKITLDSSL